MWPYILNEVGKSHLEWIIHNSGSLQCHDSYVTWRTTQNSHLKCYTNVAGQSCGQNLKYQNIQPWIRAVMACSQTRLTPYLREPISILESNGGCTYISAAKVTSLDGVRCDLSSI